MRSKQYTRIQGPKKYLLLPLQKENLRALIPGIMALYNPLCNFQYQVYPLTCTPRVEVCPLGPHLPKRKTYDTQFTCCTYLGKSLQPISLLGYCCPLQTSLMSSLIVVFLCNQLTIHLDCRLLSTLAALNRPRFYPFYPCLGSP